MDRSVRFSSMVGLSDHISRLEEMVLSPLQSFSCSIIQPACACLFYGPHGTGKTALVKALKNECKDRNLNVYFVMVNCTHSRDKPVARTRQRLRRLFSRAYLRRPAVICLDNLEHLVSDSSTAWGRKRRRLVKALLSLMNDITSRSGVVLIGATNKPECLDPVLLRSGKFDQVFCFELPNKKRRVEMLRIILRRFRRRLSEDLLERLADECSGFSGAEIKLLHAKAILCARQRCDSERSETELSTAKIKRKVTEEDLFMAIKRLVPDCEENRNLYSKPLSSVIKPLLEKTFAKALKALMQLFPSTKDKPVEEENIGSTKFADKSMAVAVRGHKLEVAGPLQDTNRIFQEIVSYRPIFILAGQPSSGKTIHLIPALIDALRHFPVYTLGILGMQFSPKPAEQIFIQAFHTAKRTVPSILYIPGIDYFWKSAAPRLQSLFIRLVRDIDPSLPLLLLATCDSDPFVPLLLLTVRESDGEELPKQIADPFPETEHPCIFKVELPSKEEREVFFQQLLGLPPSNKTAVLSKRMRGENQEDSEQKLKQQKVSHSSSEEGSESELETGCIFLTHSSSGPEAVVSKRMRGENQEDSEQKLKQQKASHSSSEEGSESELETGCIFLTHSSSGPEEVTCGGSEEKVDHLEFYSTLPSDYAARMHFFHTIMEKTKDWDLVRLESLYSHISFLISAYDNNFRNLGLIQAVEEVLQRFFTSS